jgi:hypothetical protein
VVIMMICISFVPSVQADIPSSRVQPRSAKVTP